MHAITNRNTNMNTKMMGIEPYTHPGDTRYDSDLKEGMGVGEGVWVARVCPVQAPDGPEGPGWLPRPFDPRT